MAELNLVADIGGTNARFALMHRQNDSVNLLDVQHFQAAEYPSVSDAASQYLEAVGVRVKAACFACAGPVRGDEVIFSNSHWKIKSSEIEAALSLDRLSLINDFYALAAGVPYLADSAYVDIKSGTAVTDAPKLVLGPGTGLGQALIVPNGISNRVISTEGGHVSFASLSEEDFAVRNIIAHKYGRLSTERMLSGHGLENLYEAQSIVMRKSGRPLKAAEITADALKGDNDVAIRTVDMFCETLGSVAGDAVLSSGARGGVILGGGILPKILPLFLKSKFIERFNDKGRMSHYVKDTPVKLITADGTALYGASQTLLHAKD